MLVDLFGCIYTVFPKLSSSLLNCVICSTIVWFNIPGFPSFCVFIQFHYFDTETPLEHLVR